MEDPLEAVSVRWWNTLEHVADYVRTAILQSEFCRPQLRSVIENFWKIQDQAGEMRVRFEKGADQTSLPPAYVANGPNSREIIPLQSVENQAAMSDGHRGHSGVKVAAIAAVRARVFKRRGAELSDKCVLLAFPDHVRQMFPNGVMLRPFA
jgi:hypothetical protein